MENDDSVNLSHKKGNCLMNLLIYINCSVCSVLCFRHKSLDKSNARAKTTEEVVNCCKN